MNKTVVIADDDPVVTRLVSLSLSITDFKVVGCANGDEALAAIRAHDLAVAILDLDMPGPDGMTVLRTVKSDAATHDVPVMILTADRDTEMVLKALRAGAADYLVKPFDPDQLMDRVSRLATGQTPVPRLVEDVWEI